MNKNNYEKILDSELFKRYPDVMFFLFTLGLYSFFLFSIIYAFIYGYYFGGLKEDISFNFHMYSNLIDVDPRIFTVIAIYFTGMYYLIKYFFDMVKTNKLSPFGLICSVVSLIVLISLFLVIFFVGKLSFQSLISFFIIQLIWLLMLFSFYSAFILSKREDLFLHIFLNVVIFSLIFIPLFTDSITLIATVLFMIAFLNFVNIRKMQLLNLYFLQINIVTSIYAINMYSIVATLIFSFLVGKFYKKIVDKDMLMYSYFEDEIIYSIDHKNVNKSIIYIITNHLIQTFIKKNNPMNKFAIVICILAIFTLTPQLALISGKLIRDFTFPPKSQFEIQYYNEEKKLEKIEMNYYFIDSKGITYSNSQWMLEIIRIDKYKIVQK